MPDPCFDPYRVSMDFFEAEKGAGIGEFIKILHFAVIESYVGDGRRLIKTVQALPSCAVPAHALPA